MKTAAYYNEFCPKAAAWLQQLIDDKQIPYGYVDTRSILEVQPSDLSGFTQCHFFAGIGGWSLALRRCGWPDDRPVWTASLPCQSFSTAGKQLGTADERHLWPTFERLVREHRPPTLFGEQVASKLARTDWLPGVCLDLQALGYSATAVDLCSPCAGEVGEGRIVRGDQESWERVIIGQPHIRQRLYWVAYPCGQRVRGRECREDVGEEGARESKRPERERVWVDSRDANHWVDGLAQSCDHGAGSISGEASGCGREPRDTGTESIRQAHGSDGTGGADARSSSCTNGVSYTKRGRSEKQWSAFYFPSGQFKTFLDASSSGATLLIPCRDGKTRRTQSGIFPLVNGLPRGVVPSGDPSDPQYANATAEARAMRLKGYGNAIQIDTATLFIKSCMEVIDK